MKAKSAQQVSLVAGITGRGTRVGVSLRAQDRQEKITEGEESDLVATSWWRLTSSGKKFRGSREEREESARQLSENQARTSKQNRNLLIFCYIRVCEFWSRNRT